MSKLQSVSLKVAFGVGLGILVAAVALEVGAPLLKGQEHAARVS